MCVATHTAKTKTKQSSCARHWSSRKACRILKPMKRNLRNGALTLSSSLRSFFYVFHVSHVYSRAPGRYFLRLFNAPDGETERDRRREREVGLGRERIERAGARERERRGGEKESGKSEKV